MKYLIQFGIILASLLLIISNTSGQWGLVMISINVTDDAGSPSYEMVFGNYDNATWGMGGQKDSINSSVIEKESPPLPYDRLVVVWKPARSGVSWGIGFIKYDIKGIYEWGQKDTFRLFFLIRLTIVRT